MNSCLGAGVILPEAARFTRKAGGLVDGRLTGISCCVSASVGGDCGRGGGVGRGMLLAGVATTSADCERT